MAKRYTLTGSVRGNCGHNHRTISGAAACYRRDSEGCASQGGYSDRHLVVIDDGEEREPTDAEQGDFFDCCDSVNV